MARIKIGSSTVTVAANKAETTYSLESGETVSTGNFGIEASGIAEGREIRIDGAVTATLAAVRLGINGTATAAVEILIGQDGRLSSMNTGLIAYGGGHMIRNQGEISGGASGILAYGAQTIVNSGLVEGSIAVDLVGVDGHGVTLRNMGTLDGTSAAIRGGEFGDTIINTGQVQGDALLGAGDDTFVFRDGAVAGKIRGGFGNDTYVIARTGLQILEEGGQGWDTVRTYVDHGLADNVEVLRLMGKGNLLGVGNGGDNQLFGNAGSNSLYGSFGNDMLAGGRGDDILSGASGADAFHFSRRTGTDAIIDYAPGVDEVHFHGLKGATDFAGMMADHVTDIAGDVLIAYGSDVVVLKDTMKSELVGADFVFS